MFKYKTEIIKNLAKLVSYDSSLKPAETNMPFGKGACDALSCFLNLADGMGFVTINYDNYIGEVIFGGDETANKNADSLGILAHLDVVPAGDGWSYPPFTLTQTDGKLYGRGTVDDKGPALICLYCLYELKQNCFKPQKPVRLIVGCNEEDGWRCIEHFNKCAVMPNSGFSPDSDFPAVYAEKGIAHVQFALPLKNAPFTYLKGGSAVNMVCGLCKAKPAKSISGFSDKALLDALKLSYADGYIISRGKCAHGSLPHLGIDAIQPVLEYFAATDERLISVLERLFEDKYKLRSVKDDISALTMSANTVEYKDDTLYITVDLRYPPTLVWSDILAKINKFNLKYEVLRVHEPLYTDKNSELIRTLLKAYNGKTNGEAQPIAIGGGTYARAMKSCAGFGPTLPDEEPLEHQPDEYITLDKLEFLFDVYLTAISLLSR